MTQTTLPPLQALFFEDLTIGLSETISKDVLSEDVIAFADISGDHNPIHISDEFASKTIFGQRIAHGLFTASLISAVLGTRLPGPGAVYLSQTLHFHAPVHIGDTVAVTCTVIELVEHGHRAKLKCECKVGDKVVLEGEAVVKVPTRPRA